VLVISAPDPVTQRRTGRRAVLGAAAGVVGLGAGAAALWWPRSDADALPGLTTWPTGRDFSVLSADEESFLAEGVLPGVGTVYESMARQAMLDLYRLMQANGSAEFPYTFIAGPDGAWRYSWPRDAAFAAVAFFRTGHQAEALWILSWLRVVQDLGVAEGGAGGFEARYTSTGETPDRRKDQADGAGWAAWAMAEVLTGPGSSFQTVADLDDRFRWPFPWSMGGESHAPTTAGLSLGCQDRIRGCPPPTPLSALVQRTGDYLLGLTDDGRRLPEPSSDYWERRESRLTLGTAAGI
jgi:glucoamylase